MTNRHLDDNRGKGFALEKMLDFPKISLAAKQRFSWLIFKRGFQNLWQEIWEQSSLYKLSVQTVTSQFFLTILCRLHILCLKPALLGIGQCSCFILSKTICRKFPGEERCTFYVSFLIPFSIHCWYQHCLMVWQGSRGFICTTDETGRVWLPVLVPTWC